MLDMGKAVGFSTHHRLPTTTAMYLYIIIPVYYHTCILSYLYTNTRIRVVSVTDRQIGKRA